MKKKLFLVFILILSFTFLNAQMLRRVDNFGAFPSYRAMASEDGVSESSSIGLELGLELGYGSTSQLYDNVGKRRNFAGTHSVLNVGLEGRYHFFAPKIGSKLYIGGRFNFSQVRFSNDEPFISSSGFSPQYLELLIGGSYLFINGKFGFQFDLGPKMDVLRGKIQNSDRQNAILIGLEANIPSKAGLSDFHMFHISLDYAYTFERSEKNYTIDWGDHITLAAGGGYKVGLSKLASISFGIDVVYTSITKLKIDNEFLELSRNRLSLLPYVNYKSGPLSLWCKLGTIYGPDGEYEYSGISITGKNLPVTKLGFSVIYQLSF
ncbi:MAG: hypothetical protein ACK44H_04020 [Candidatus Kryptonium sp.]